jgi:hypothetical protein
MIASSSLVCMKSRHALTLAPQNPHHETDLSSSQTTAVVGKSMKVSMLNEFRPARQRYERLAAMLTIVQASGFLLAATVRLRFLHSVCTSQKDI